LRIIYMGTADVSLKPLEEINKYHDVLMVVTNPDRINSRGKKIKQSKIKLFAKENNIKLFQPERVSDEENVKILKELGADVIVVCAYGQLLKENVLNLTKYGCINIHASYLPRLRGASPINTAIIDGDSYSGVTIMQMDKGLDTGDMLLREKILIDENMNADNLTDKVSEIGAKLILKTLEDIDKIEKIEQNESEATYAKKISKEDSHINFESSARNVHNLIRGLYSSYTGYAFIDEKKVKLCESFVKNDVSDVKSGTIIKYNKKEKCIEVSCDDYVIGITRLQMQGKREMSATDFINGNKDIIGKIFK